MWWISCAEPKKGTDVPRLAVMAHFDPDGSVLRPHVQRQIEALAEAVDDLVVVTTADLTVAAHASLARSARVIERRNYGYDFFSYKVGLEAVDVSRYDEVTVCNDSYIGPLTSYQAIFDRMSGRDVDFWGLSETDRVSHHVQSFFVTFRPPVLASDTFREFWSEMTPLSRRYKVIRRYEVGLSTALYNAGFRSAPYFVESADDRRAGRRRVRWWALRRSGLPTTRKAASDLRQHAREPWNPSIGLADRALDNGRLPYVKVDTLRYDPYDLGADRLLSYCEEQFPHEFSGVRDYLRETAHFYPRRRSEHLRELPHALRPVRPLVRYRRQR